ncbi:MAG TPA: ADOP family duplicated permease [Vicinamibacterales bacterium]|nr:ADOP family duplicated permease [Vicinamibacterales bacterium]
MDALGRAWRRLLFWVHRRRVADELREEIEAHRRLRQEACERAGAADPAQASRRALGNVLLARDEARDVWIWPTLDSVARDVQYALTGLRRQPAFAVTAILTIAVGTGVLASVLAVAYTVLLRPTPFPTAPRLVQISQVANGRDRMEVSTADVLALREGAPALALVTYAWFSEASLTGEGLPERARRVYTDWQAFHLLGVQPLLGRLPTAQDDAPGAEPVVAIGHRLWSERFTSDRTVIGRTLRLDGRPHTIIAVMPPQFRFPAPYWAPGDLWVLRSAAHPDWPRSRNRTVLAFGLLHDAADIRRAQLQADAVADSLNTVHADETDGIGLRLAPWADSARAAARPRVRLIAGAAGVLFLIVCLNVTNLLLSRGLDRRRELAARVALGAGTARLVRQLLTETAVLFALGGALGIAASVWGSRLIITLRSYAIPRMDEATVDTAVAVTAMAIAIAAAAVVGLVPALQAAGARMSDLAAGSARGTARGHGWRRTQRALVAAEVGLALVLLCGAAVLLEGSRRLAKVDPGFDPKGIVHARVSLPPDKYESVAQQSAFFDRVLADLSAIHGVQGAGAVSVPPGVGGSDRPSVLLEGEAVPASAASLRRANPRVVSAGYLETLGVRTRAGRLFSKTDTSGAPVAIVNEAFVRRYMKEREVIGRRLRITFTDMKALDHVPRTIVGVVPDLKEKTLYEPAPPVVYVLVGQTDWRVGLRMALLVRSDRPMGDIIMGIRSAVAGADPDQAAHGFMALDALMEGELSLNRLTLVLLGVLSAIAMLLAMIGVYGVTAHAVRQRTHEIGIRLALGLSRGGVMRLLLGEAGAGIAIGIAAGAVGVMCGAGLLRSLVLGIDRTNTATFVAAGTILAAAVLAGCYLPARRAARIDPAVVLRLE